MQQISPQLTLKEVIMATGATVLAGGQDTVFHGVCTDSRQLKGGNLFVALKGDNFDGHDFAQKALELGAAGIMISDAVKADWKGAGSAAVIKVADTLTALGDLAHYWRSRFFVPVIGLTGSSGKTTTKEIMASIISRQKNVLKTEGNLNNLIGLPQTIFRFNDDHEAAILEMGTNMPGEIKRLTQIAAPDIGLITNIGPAHLAGLISIEGVRKEKGDLFAYMDKNGTAVFNLDDENIRIISDGWKGRRVTFSMTSDADVRLAKMEKSNARGMSLKLIIAGKEHKVEMKIAGTHNVYNALAAAATALALQIDVENIIAGLGAFTPVGGRMQVIRLKKGAYLIDDSYNANPASMREALMTLKDLKNGHSSYAFLGDMLELGDAAEEMHRKIGMLAAVTGVNKLFLQGDFAKATAAGAVEGGMPADKIVFLSAPEEGVLYLKQNLKKGDWVLVKGSRRMKMERISARICGDFGCDTADEKNTK